MKQNISIITAANLDLFPSGVGPKTIHENVVHRKSTKLAICFLGIFISYLIFGIFQESMYVNNQSTKPIGFVLDFF